MSMRERFARAIHDVMENLPPEDNQAYLVAADAILKILNEPTEAMVHAAANVDLGVPRADGFIGPVAARAAWRAMIAIAKADQS